MSSGFCQHPPQPTVRVAKTEVCSFTKDDNTATGAVGLLTYDLFHMQSRVCSERLAVMFSVPFDHNLYRNRLAVGVVEQTCACDKSLYDQMYEGKDVSKLARCETNGGGLELRATYVDVRATMSTVGKAIVKVELFDKMGRWMRFIWLFCCWQTWRREEDWFCVRWKISVSDSQLIDSPLAYSLGLCTLYTPFSDDGNKTLRPNGCVCFVLFFVGYFLTECAFIITDEQ